MSDHWQHWMCRNGWWWQERQRIIRGEVGRGRGEQRTSKVKISGATEVKHLKENSNDGSGATRSRTDKCLSLSGGCEWIAMKTERERAAREENKICSQVILILCFCCNELHFHKNNTTYSTKRWNVADRRARERAGCLAGVAGKRGETRRSTERRRERREERMSLWWKCWKCVSWWRYYFMCTYCLNGC